MGELQGRVQETDNMTDADKARNILIQMERYFVQKFHEDMERLLSQLEDQAIVENIRNAKRGIEMPNFEPFSEAWNAQLRTNLYKKEAITKYLMMVLNNA